jgi:hypothetical protein
VTSLLIMKSRRLTGEHPLLGFELRQGALITGCRRDRQNLLRVQPARQGCAGIAAPGC